MQQPICASVPQWPAFPWGQLYGVPSTLQTSQNAPEHFSTGSLRPQKIVLQPLPTGLGMNISFASPAGQQPPAIQYQQAAYVQHTGQPWVPASQRLITGHQRPSTSSNQPVAHQASQPAHKDMATAQSFYAQDRAALAARPRIISPAARKKMKSLEKARRLQTLKQGSQQAQSQAEHEALPAQQQVVEATAAMQHDAVCQEQQEVPHGLDLLVLAAEEADAAAGLTKQLHTSNWRNDADTMQPPTQQHDEHGDAAQSKQAALLAACASALGQESAGMHSTEQLANCAEASSGAGTVATLPAPAAAEQHSASTAAARDANTRHAIAAALAAMEGQEPVDAGISAGRSTATAVPAATAGSRPVPSRRPKRAAARDADILRQVALQEERHPVRKASIRHHSVEERLRSLELAAKLQQQRQQQQQQQQQPRQAQLPPLPPRKRRSSSPSHRKRSSGALAATQPSPAPAVLTVSHPLIPACGRAVAAVAAEAEAAAQRAAGLDCKRIKISHSSTGATGASAAQAIAQHKSADDANAPAVTAEVATTALAAAFAKPRTPAVFLAGLAGQKASACVELLHTATQEVAAASFAGKQQQLQQAATAAGCAHSSHPTSSRCADSKDDLPIKAGIVGSTTARTAGEPDAAARDAWLPTPAAADAAKQAAEVPAAGPPAAAGVLRAVSRPRRSTVGATVKQPAALTASGACCPASAAGDGPSRVSAASRGRAQSLAVKARRAAVVRGNPKSPGHTAAGPAQRPALRSARTAGTAAAAAAGPADVARATTAQGKSSRPPATAQQKQSSSNSEDTVTTSSSSSSGMSSSSTSLSGMSTSSLTTSCDTSDSSDAEYKAPRRAAASSMPHTSAATAVVPARQKKTGPKGGRPLGAANKNEMAPRRVNAAGQATYGCRSQQYRGVYMCQRATTRWRTQFSYARKVLNVGSFETEEDAARAWNAAAMHFRGADCWVNPVDPVLPDDGGLSIAQSLPQPEGGSLLPAAKEAEV